MLTGASQPVEINEFPNVTDEERFTIRDIKYGTKLTACHPMVVTAVTAKVSALLKLLGRPDLADLWARM